MSRWEIVSSAARLTSLAGFLFVAACAEAPETEVQQNPEWHLDRIDQRELPLDHEYRYAHTGDGVRIYVVDDGVRENDDFAARLVRGLQLHGPEPTGDHGTRAAGAAAGTAYGVAKHATIVDVHAYEDPPDDAGLGDLTAEAYRWIARNHPRGTPGVVVNAWGLSDGADAVGAVRDLLDAGLPVVLSAGNLDEEVGEPGALPLPDPELNSEMIVVGATTERDERWSESSYGRHVDIYAPGADLTLPSGEGSGTTSGTSGTSWAAPILAGVIAMMLESDPARSPAEVKEALTEQATEGVITRLPDGSHNRLLYRPLE